MTPNPSDEQSAFGMPAKLKALIDVHPRIGPRFDALYSQIMCASARFAPHERAMIAAVSARAQQCSYLVEAFTQGLGGEGVDAPLAASFFAPTGAINYGHWSEPTLISYRNRVLCRIADKLSATPTAITRKDWQPLLDSGSDSLELIEFAFLVGLSNYMTHLIDGFGLSSGRSSIALEIARDGPPDLAPRDISDAFIKTPSDDKSAGQVSSVGWFLKVHAPGPPKDSPYNFGLRSEMGTLLGTHPLIGPAFWALFSEIMFSPGALTRAEREMVAAVAAAAQECHY
jgi:alkylhydroperoxidase family enzyme